MRKVFFSRARARYSDDIGGTVIDVCEARTVFELDPSPIPTGILDADGNEIMYAYEMDQIGFVRHE